MSIFNDKALKSVAEAAAKVMQQEELKGNQHKIDANKNGKVDAHDFKLLRGKKNLKEDDTGYQDRYAVKNGKAVKHNPMRGERDEPHHVWADSAEHAVRKHAAKTAAPVKEEVQQLDELDAAAIAAYKASPASNKKSSVPERAGPGPSKFKQKMAAVSRTGEKGHDYFGHDAKRQQSGYRGPGQSVMQTAADKVKKGIGAIKKVFSKEELEMIEAEQMNEAFPTVADAKKRMDAGKTATGSVTKTATGLVHKRDYKDDDNDETPKKSTGYGARQNYKRSTRVNEGASFTEMLELYNEHGLKVLAPIETEEMDIDGTTIQVIDGDKINGFVETMVEEPDNALFTKELKDQEASAAGKKPQPKVAAGKTTGVKTMPESVEQIDERELSKDEAKKKEDYVKGMKKGLSGFKERYGERAKSVMYATATKMAKKD